MSAPSLERSGWESAGQCLVVGPQLQGASGLKPQRQRGLASQTSPRDPPGRGTGPKQFHSVQRLTRSSSLENGQCSEHRSPHTSSPSRIHAHMHAHVDHTRAHAYMHMHSFTYKETASAHHPPVACTHLLFMSPSGISSQAGPALAAESRGGSADLRGPQPPPLPQPCSQWSHSWPWEGAGP